FNPATPSQVVLDLDRESFVGDITFDAGTVLEATTANGQVVLFEVDADLAFVAADPGPWSDAIGLTAVETGTATNVPFAGTTWALQGTGGTSLSAPDDVSFSADENAAGGSDVETDAQ